MVISKKKQFSISLSLVPEESGKSMLYKFSFKEDLNVSVIGGFDCKNLTVDTLSQSLPIVCEKQKKRHFKIVANN